MIENFKIYDANNLKSQCIQGDYLAMNIQGDLLQEINKSGPNKIWNIDLSNAIFFDNYFIGGLFNNILKNYGAVLPDNTVLMLACKYERLIGNIEKGLCWDEGKVFPEDMRKSIRESGKFIVVYDSETPVQ